MSGGPWQCLEGHGNVWRAMATSGGPWQRLEGHGGHQNDDDYNLFYIAGQRSCLKCLLMHHMLPSIMMPIKLV